MFDWLRSKISWAATVRPVLLDRAAALQRSAALSGPDRALALAEFEQGNRQRESNQLDTAQQHYRRALALHPAYAPACANLGALLKDSGKPAEAEQYLAFAIQLEPQLVPARFNLAMLRVDQGRWSDAVAHLHDLLALSPNHADAQYWLGNALTGLGDVAGARRAYQAAVRLQPGYVQARWGLAMAQLPVVPQAEAEHAQGCEAFGQELDRLAGKMLATYSATGHLAVGAQQPYYLAYRAANHRDVLSRYGDLCAKLMATWAKKVGVPAPASAHPGKCRVGIVSAHIHSHSVWHALVRGWVEHLPVEDFEIQIFHTGRGRDAETQWAEQRVAQLHHGLGHWSQWAKAISDAQLDVLIYPEIGMDATTVRLSALRLARVQLASWGHPLTTGLPTMDGYISADAMEPHEAADHYREALITLPRLGCCYQLFGTAPARLDFAQWGIQATDRVLLCAGTPFKYAPQHDAVLIDIARRCQPCKLVFFRSEPRAVSDLLEARLRSAFETQGMDFDASVVFVPWQPQPGFFAWLDRADVYLDTLGFSGFNTVMQAVERATPLVAFEGAFLRGRFASAVLRQMGLDDWVAESLDRYVALVEQLVQDRAARSVLRQHLQERRAALFGDRGTVMALGEHLLRLSR